MTEGLKESIAIIDKEIEAAKRINPIIVMGMERIKDVIMERLEKEINN